jgi:hypothetical protein
VGGYRDRHVDRRLRCRHAGACYAGDERRREILLPPTEGTEFFGSALEPDWLLRDWVPPGATTTSVGGGVLTDNMARINRDPLSGPSAYGPADRSNSSRPSARRASSTSASAAATERRRRGLQRAAG